MIRPLPTCQPQLHLPSTQSCSTKTGPLAGSTHPASLPGSTLHYPGPPHNHPRLPPEASGPILPRQLWSGSGEQGLCSLTFGAQTLALALTGCVMNKFLNLLMLQDCSSAHHPGLTGQDVTVLAHGEGLVRVSSEDVRAHLLSDSLPSRNAYCLESGHIFTLPGTFRYPTTASLPCPHQSVVKSSRQRLFLNFLCIPPASTHQCLGGATYTQRSIMHGHL